MFFITRQDRELFVPNGIWGRRCYLLPDAATRTRLKWLYRLIVIATLLLFIAAALADSWWLLGIGVVLLIAMEKLAVKHLCRHCETVEQKFTLGNFIEE